MFFFLKLLQIYFLSHFLTLCTNIEIERWWISKNGVEFCENSGNIKIFVFTAVGWICQIFKNWDSQKKSNFSFFLKSYRMVILVIFSQKKSSLLYTSVKFGWFYVAVAHFSSFKFLKIGHIHPTAVKTKIWIFPEFSQNSTPFLEIHHLSISIFVQSVNATFLEITNRV